MTSKELIRRVLTFDDPPRFGLAFNPPNFSDVKWVSAWTLVNKKYEAFAEWGRYPEVLSEVPDFTGEVRRDRWGNIFGRLNEKTGGECLKGALQDGWELINDFAFPEMESIEKLEPFPAETFNVCPITSVFSPLRDVRRIDNALADTILETENVSAFLERIIIFGLAQIRAAAAAGADAVSMCDDWGTQHATLISPESFNELFKPIYAALADEIHNRGMFYFFHSCGRVYKFINDLIDAGIDALMFDQPELSGIENLAEDFGGRVTFCVPVDIQKTMNTGDRILIESAALKMSRLLMKNGGFIAADYGSWKDINVTEEWAGWARKVFMREAGLAQ